MLACLHQLAARLWSLAVRGDGLRLGLTAKRRGSCRAASIAARGREFYGDYVRAHKRKSLARARAANDSGCGVRKEQLAGADGVEAATAAPTPPPPRSVQPD